MRGRREEDLPRIDLHACLPGKHLLLAIYPSTGTLKMFNKDRVAVVHAHSALLLPLWFQAMATHLGRCLQTLKNKQTNKQILQYSGIQRLVSSAKILCLVLLQIFQLRVNLLQLLSPIWHKLGEGKYSGRPVPDGGKVSYLFRGFFFVLFPSPRREAPVLFRTQGL